MNLKDLSTAVSFDLWFVPVFPEEFPSKSGSRGRIKVDDAGNHTLVINYVSLPVKLREFERAHDLDFHLMRGCAHLAEVLQVVSKDSAVECVLLRAVFFSGMVVEMEDVCVGIDEKIAETAQKNNIRFSVIEDLCKLLCDKCTITVGNETYFLMLCGVAAEDDFADVAEDVPRSFALYGERVVIPVERRRLDSEREAFFATKIVFKEPQKGERAFRLVHGTLRIVDFTKTGEESEIKALARAALNRLVDGSGSFLSLWEKYSNTEGNMLLDRARKIGVLRVLNTEGPNFFFQDEVPEALTTNDSLQMVTDIPLYLQNITMDWAAYLETLETEQKNRDVKSAKEETIRYPVNGISGNIITTDMEVIPPDGSSLMLSITGDEIQIERREKARKNVMEGRCANPLLGILIAENGVPPNIARAKKIPPLTPFVRDKIFRNEPREIQKRAIEIALNTPDFALIQGPPGTGKTTIVTAIVERLNELYDKTGNVRGKILVSGAQHDAVENITSRLSINALPAVKFGRRSNGEEDDNEVTIQKWSEDLIDKIHVRHKNLADLEQQERQRKLRELFEIYAKIPSSATALAILEFIITLPRDSVSEVIIDRARNIMDALVEEETPEEAGKLRLIRSLRLTAEGFTDDGPDRALEILDAFENELTSEENAAFLAAASWKTGSELPFLKELRAIKKRLLLLYAPPPRYRIEKPRSDMLEMIGDVRGQLEKNRNRGDRRNAALAEFLHELENNPEGVKENLADYSLVFASTVQYAGSEVMTKKKIGAGNPQISYDTVIIDEAARVLPLDLLIPLSQAEKRIILVGDHRQLPQLIDEEIVEKALNDETPLNAETYKQAYSESMFGYLFKRLKKLEEHDHIPRTITLDAQFRMHPLLGRFVSDYFYRQYGEEFDSPLAEEYFRHNLPGTGGKAALWLDAPFTQGGHKKQGTSWVRKSEAECIAEYLAQWIDCPEGKGLSFGIISFYKAQVELLKEVLISKGITRKGEEGVIEIDERYKKRLRIGTVDSFQGMEFDIVFLSIVRSKSIRNELATDELKKSVFGFLLSVNRLCVSMSRQKKLLVVVGDANLAQSELAEEAVPGLHGFYRLCKERGLVL